MSELRVERVGDRPAPATGVALLRAVAADIKLAHTVFALPFAVLGAVLAARWAGRWPAWGEAALVLWCMVWARTAAMAMNRWLDAGIDARNPRTAGRAVPAGRVSARAMGGVVVVSGALFLLGAAGFGWLRGNWWPAALGPVVLAWLLGYGLTKRFTWLCHVYLGVALALSPVAAALAVEPGFVAARPAVWLIAGMVACWVAGFDVVYALADVAYDKADGLYSMPSRLGVDRALRVSGALHVVSVVALAGAWWSSATLGAVFGVGVVATAALLVVEHAVVWRSATRRLDLAFFTLNGVISVLLGVAGVVDAVVRHAV